MLLLYRKLRHDVMRTEHCAVRNYHETEMCRPFRVTSLNQSNFFIYRINYMRTGQIIRYLAKATLLVQQI